MTRRAVYVVVDAAKVGAGAVVRAFYSESEAKDLVELLNSTSLQPNFTVQKLWLYGAPYSIYLA